MIELQKKADCCGCSACYQVCRHGAITFELDEEGFFYPEVNKNTCVDCALCNKVCPIIKYKGKPKDGNPLIYAAVNNDYNQYMQSSSGGIFILLCKYILSQGGVVCGAIYDDDFSVRHEFAETLSECYKFQGSKYVQSDIRGIYTRVQEFLKKGTKVLFSGTPCQVEGLKLFLFKEYENLYLVDIICHGVPSPLMFREYLKFVSSKSAIKAINMKSKIAKQKGTAIRIDFVDGSSQRQTLKTELWNRLYFNHYIVRPSCHNCQFTNYNRAGNMTIGDYWGIEKYHPKFHPEMAVSLVMANDAKGQFLFRQIISHTSSIALKKEECIQPQLSHPSPANSERAEFWIEYKNTGFNKIAEKYLGYTWHNRLKCFANKLLRQIK